MDVLKQIINFIIGFLAPDKKELIQLSAKKRAIASLKLIHPNSYIFKLNGVMFEILPDSWSSAREAGKTFEQVLNLLTNKSFKILDLIAKEFKNGVSVIGLTSLWRQGDPNTNVHTCGRGIDIGYIIMIGTGKYLTTKPYKTEPPIFKNLRAFAWDTGLLWQWIGPNKIRYGVKEPWINNTGKNSLEIAHQNHIHFTVGV